MKKIIIIGSGLAGISAAREILLNHSKELEVTILEARDIVGGKASAWQDSEGDWIESGLHVFFGSYKKIFELLKEVNAYENISWQSPSIQYKFPGGEGFSIVSHEFLPCPLNLLPNFFFSHHFSLSDLLRYCKALIPVLRGDRDYIARQDNKSFAQWVQEQNMSQEIAKKMFGPMTLSLKFVPADQISAAAVLNVFRLFVADPKGFKIGFLKGSPALKMFQPLIRHLRTQGLRLQLSSKVQSLYLEQERLKGVILRTGELIEGDHFIFALPAHKLSKILTPYFSDIPYFQNLKNFTGAPVMNAQFWLDRRIMTDRRLHFGGGKITPVFADMSLACQEYKPQNDASLIESVIAPAADLAHLSDDEILDLAWQDFQSYFPATNPQTRILKSTLVRIPHSVYWPKPGLERMRPAQQTPIENIYLAGGVTKGHEFFDSQEGAVQSGQLAASEILKKL